MLDWRRPSKNCDAAENYFSQSGAVIEPTFDKLNFDFCYSTLI
jgi:hypothetical protein